MGEAKMDLKEDRELALKVVEHQLKIATAELQGMRLDDPEIERWLRAYAKVYLGKELP